MYVLEGEGHWEGRVSLVSLLPLQMVTPMSRLPRDICRQAYRPGPHEPESLPGV